MGWPSHIHTLMVDGCMAEWIKGLEAVCGRHGGRQDTIPGGREGVREWQGEREIANPSTDVMCVCMHDMMPTDACLSARFVLPACRVSVCRGWNQFKREVDRQTDRPTDNWAGKQTHEDRALPRAPPPPVRRISIVAGDVHDTAFLPACLAACVAIHGCSHSCDR